MNVIECCKLCKCRPADQTGSHIFSWFLIRDAINKENAKRRHNEVSFEISVNRFVKTYFGNEILPEDIMKLKGRPLSEIEIEDMINPFTQDNIVCQLCEKRFSVLESKVNDKIFTKLRAHHVKSGQKFETLEIEETDLMRLFIYSLCWRAAVVHQNHFLMEDKHREQLGIVLDDILTNDEHDLVNNCKKNYNKIRSYPLIITFQETSGQNTNPIYCSLLTRPYAMIINELSFQLFFNEKSTKSIHESLFSINQIIPLKSSVNIREAKMILQVLSDESRQLVYGRLYSFIGDKMIRHAGKLFREFFTLFTKKRAPEGLVDYFKSQFIYNNNSAKEKYTPELMIHTASVILYQYYLSYPWIFKNPI